MEKVLLLNLPWATPLEPSLGVAILKAVYEKEGVVCDVYDTQLEMLRWVSHNTYQEISQAWALCDFIFTGELDRALNASQLHLAKRICRSYDITEPEEVNIREPGWEELYRKSLKMRREIVPKFLDTVMDEVDWNQYSLIGFTCLFDQTFASLALAKRIRERKPEILMAFGGYALQEPVGRHLQTIFPHLMDVVAQGDGEPTVLPLYEAARGWRPLSEVPNIIYLDEAGNSVTTRSAQCNLDDIPTPDYRDYFLRKDRLEREHKVVIRVPTLQVESSRGCWWGQKNHCVFCGIDDETMKYRAKSPARVIEELDDLHRCYGAVHFRFSDYILPHGYFKTLLPKLGQMQRPYRLQYESKSNLNADKLDVMKQAGLFYAQLGIESLSTPVLQRMRKGVSAIQNIFSLHGLMRRGILPYYNLLFGFPGDQISDYEKMIELLPALYHLQPPGQCIWVQITRFAPLAEKSREYGHRGKLQHHWRYEVLFSDEFLKQHPLDLSKICYSFESYNKTLIDPTLKERYDVLQLQWWRWRSQSGKGAKLSYQTSGDRLIFHDSRTSPKVKSYAFDGPHAQIYALLANDICDEKLILDTFSHHSAKRVHAALNELLKAQVAIREGRRYLGLAFPESLYRQHVFWWLQNDGWDDFLSEHNPAFNASRASATRL